MHIFTIKCDLVKSYTAILFQWVNGLCLHCWQDGKLILSSAAWGTPLSALWKTGDGVLEQVYEYSLDHCLDS